MMGVQIMTHIPSDPAEWVPISMAPPDGQDLEVCVMDYDELVVSPPYPCHRSGGDLFDASNKARIDVQPTHWRKWPEHRAKGV